MGEFDFLATWEFWISAVIVGLLVNLLAAAIWKYGPKLLGKVSDRWAERNEEARRARETQIQRLIESEKRTAELRYQVLESQNSAIVGLVLATLSLLFYLFAVNAPMSELLRMVVSLLSLTMTLVILFMAVLTYRISTAERRLLSEATRRLQQEREPADETENDD